MATIKLKNANEQINPVKMTQKWRERRFSRIWYRQVTNRGEEKLLENVHGILESKLVGFVPVNWRWKKWIFGNDIMGWGEHTESLLLNERSPKMSKSANKWTNAQKSIGIRTSSSFCVELLANGGLNLWAKRRRDEMNWKWENIIKINIFGQIYSILNGFALQFCQLHFPKMIHSSKQ